MKTKNERPAAATTGQTKELNSANVSYHSKRWLSSDNPPRMLWRLQKGIFSSPMKSVTIGDVEDNAKRALEFIARIAGEQSANLPALSPAALRDFDIVSTLLEINHSVSLIGKRTSEAFEYLIKEEQELGMELAKVALEAVHNDFQVGSGGETLRALGYAIENFQTWLEFLTDAAACIKLGINRGAA